MISFVNPCFTEFYIIFCGCLVPWKNPLGAFKTG